MPYHRAALGALRARRATLDVTVSAVLLSGFAISTIHHLLGRHDLYFDAMAMFIFFLLAGRLVYLQARDRVMGDGAALNALYLNVPNDLWRTAAAKPSPSIPWNWQDNESCCKQAISFQPTA